MQQLTAKQSNRLQIDQQVIKIKLLENALKYRDLHGRARLFGETIDQGDLTRAKEVLAQLDRMRSIYESKEYQKKELPYLPGNGSRVDRIKAHFDMEDGNLLFLELKENSTGHFVSEHVKTKSHIKSLINKKNMATKKKAAKKKAAPKKKVVAKKKATAKKKEGAPTLKSRVDDLVLDGKNNTEIFEALNKAKVDYSEKSVRWYASKARLAQKDAA